MSLTKKITVHSPLFTRWFGYLHERFPPVSTSLLVGTFFAAGWCSTSAWLLPTEKLTAGLRPLVGAVLLLMIFFHLRLFDEFKDHHRDKRAHPQRLLSRGVITLAALGRLLAAVLVVELVLAVWIGGAAFYWYLAVLSYSVLMRFEFGCGEWLSRHLLLYSVSHMAITPLLAIFVLTFADDRAPMQPLSLIFVAMASFGTAAFEWGRKTWAPEQEHPDADSYSSVLGPRVAALVTCFIVLLCTGSSIAWVYVSGLFWWVALVIIVAGLFAVVGIFRFIQRPMSVRSKHIELATSLLLLVSLGSITVGAIVKQGMHFQL